MNKSKALMAGAAIVALSTPLAQKDAKAASASINASAIVVDAIVLSAGQGIHFGTMTIGGAGTITVGVTGTTNGGDGVGISALGSSSSEQNGTFTIQAANQAVNFSTNLPVTLGTVNLVLDQVTITGANLALGFTGTGTTQVGTPTGVTTAAGTLNVGGRLSSLAAVGNGTYSGSFQLTATYQ